MYKGTMGYQFRCVWLRTGRSLNIFELLGGHVHGGLRNFYLLNFVIQKHFVLLFFTQTSIRPGRLSFTAWWSILEKKVKNFLNRVRFVEVQVKMWSRWLLTPLLNFSDHTCILDNYSYVHLMYWCRGIAFLIENRSGLRVSKKSVI